ncbi:hypothetical protein [Arenicella xantha]|uniref:Uncharacterized protein n=1 Tax=Arenicella xantha TaxID=644221 RepID=A0A395JMZ8_9GAMM|nr:hypothetical protein [Arenicella xantha]RBP51187.1 hypothetical protein DFR28_102606 [Arenicella xantha]
MRSSRLRTSAAELGVRFTMIRILQFIILTCFNTSVFGHENKSLSSALDVHNYCFISISEMADKSYIDAQTILERCMTEKVLDEYIALLALQFVFATSFNEEISKESIDRHFKEIFSHPIESLSDKNTDRFSPENLGEISVKLGKFLRKTENAKKGGSSIDRLNKESESKPYLPPDLDDVMIIDQTKTMINYGGFVYEYKSINNQWKINGFEQEKSNK